MMEKETHLFIIWENALQYKNQILNEIKEKFEILNIYEIEWQKEKFLENLSRFYGTNLPNAKEKAEHCGIGKFLLIIVNDGNPIYEMRNTSKGEKLVNINLFDAKEKYRKLSGGGHKIHATNNEKETNHDLTLLLGTCVKDYTNSNQKQENIIEIKQNLIGADGWEDASQMFYVLNNCLNYAILRNYENLPEEIYVNDHNDIDIICDSLEDAAYILNAEKVFPEEYRVHYKAKVGDKYANFDLRYLGDNYYYQSLEEKILLNRKYNEKGFYTLDKDDYFYTLLYHALIQKSVFKDDYKERLIKMNPSLMNKKTTEDEMIQILKYWLKKNGYIATRPTDKSVYYNLEHLRKMGTQIFNEEESFRGQNDNILNWYDFKENANILQIGFELDNIEELIKTKTSKFVTCFSEEEIQSMNDKFDYVIMYDLYYIKYLHKLLQNDGIGLLIVDNKFAISAFAGAKPQYGDVFDTIVSDNKSCFSKYAIEQELKDLGYKYNFYYALPNYKMPNVIFSDRYLPNENTTKLLYNINYLEGSTVVFSELNALKQLTKNGKFTEFANSYLVEINNKQNNQAKFISFNNNRKAKYRLMTKIFDNYVEKKYCNENAKEHIERIAENAEELRKLGFIVLDKKEKDSIISDYINCETLDEIIVKSIKNNQIEKACSIIDNWYEDLKQKFLPIERTAINPNIKDLNEEIINKLNIIKNGYIDIVFENIFYKDNEYILFDQEWYLEGIPQEFILYRAINNLYVYNQEIELIIPFKDMLERLKLVQFLDTFKEIEKYIQNEILDTDMKKFNEQSLNNLIDIKKVAIMKKQISDFEDNDIKQNDYIASLENRVKDLENDNNAKQKYITQLENQKLKDVLKKILKGKR